MSYDVTIGSFDANYTSNVGALFHNHIKRQDPLIPEADITGLQALDGLYAHEAAQLLYQAWSNINAERISYGKEYGIPPIVGEPEMEAKYNASNGWGSLVGALIFLGKITAACAATPFERVHVSA